MIVVAMRRRPAATVVAAAALCVGLTLAACGADTHPAVQEPSSAGTTPTSAMAGPTPTSPLPAPEVLTDVLYKLADPAVPGSQKIGLIEDATEADAATIDRFSKALQDNGYIPIAVSAENIAWAFDRSGDATADVTITNQGQTAAAFTFPMEFKPVPAGGWQLAKTTADILLTFEQNPATPTASPTPSPTG